MIIAIGVLALWLVLAMTYAQVAARSSPATAHAVWPYANEPEARVAEASLTGATPAKAAAIRAEAQRVLLHDPLNAVAARTAGLAAGLAGDGKAARALIAYAQMLSRRDLGAQVALIEFAVTDSDIPSALRHYDIALRGSDEADQLLMPLLVGAARDPQVARSLQPILASRPPWTLRFVYGMLQARPWSQTFLPLLLSTHLSLRVPQEQDFLRRAVQGLVDEGSIGKAARVYTVATGSSLEAGVRNGDLRHDDRLPPFDWQLVDEPGFTAVKGPVDGAPPGNVISIIAEGEQHGVAAKQLLRLMPGRHVLRFRAGAIPAGRDAGPVVQIACNAKAGSVLVKVVSPAAGPAGVMVSSQLDVPKDCASQWLTIAAGTTDDLPQSSSPWLGWFVIDPA